MIEFLNKYNAEQSVINTYMRYANYSSKKRSWQLCVNKYT